MNYYNEIKNELLNNEINRKIKNYSINKNDLITYYNVGKMLSEAGKHYGESIIKKYSNKLIGEVNKKYNETNLKRMRQFYWIIEKGATMWHQLSWSHYRLLITLNTIEDISSFLKELGLGFTFIENEYKIKLGNKYNYIDLLLYNIKFKCYVVIELKVTELKKEHIGQIQTYMNYIDKNIKTIDEDKTIGIIIVKKEDKYIMEYCSDDRIIDKEYELHTQN